MEKVNMEIHYDERESTSLSPFENVKKAICLVSGGMDSAVCLFHAVKNLGAENVKALSIHYGQKGSIELEHAKRECASLGVERYGPCTAGGSHGDRGPRSAWSSS